MKILSLFFKTKKEKECDEIKDSSFYKELLISLQNDNQTELTKKHLLKIYRTSMNDLSKQIKFFQENKIHFDSVFIKLKIKMIHSHYDLCLVYFNELKSMIDFDLKNN